MPSISTVTRSDEDSVISLTTLAFSDDPATRWMYPDPRQYLTHYPTFVRLYAGAAFDSGSVHAVAGGAGFAMWLPPGVNSDEEGLADLLRHSVESSRLTEIFDLVGQMASYQPAEPHWFLPLIGVDPICRGKGHGSALLAHMVARCDRDGQLAYLDSTNSRNVPLYERHGFERLGVIKVGSGPPVYPLLRRPRWGQLVGHDRDVDREARMPMVPIKLGRQLTLCAVLIGPVLAGRVASAERDRTAVRCEASGPRPRCVL